MTELAARICDASAALPDEGPVVRLARDCTSLPVALKVDALAAAGLAYPPLQHAAVQLLANDSGRLEELWTDVQPRRARLLVFATQLYAPWLQRWIQGDADARADVETAVQFVYDIPLLEAALRCADPERRAAAERLQRILTRSARQRAAPTIDRLRARTPDEYEAALARSRCVWSPFAPTVAITSPDTPTRARAAAQLREMLAGRVPLHLWQYLLDDPVPAFRPQLPLQPTDPYALAMASAELRGVPQNVPTEIDARMLTARARAELAKAWIARALREPPDPVDSTPGPRGVRPTCSPGDTRAADLMTAAIKLGAREAAAVLATAVASEDARITTRALLAFGRVGYFDRRTALCLAPLLVPLLDRTEPATSLAVAQLTARVLQSCTYEPLARAAGDRALDALHTNGAALALRDVGTCVQSYEPANRESWLLQAAANGHDARLAPVLLEEIARQQQRPPLWATPHGSMLLYALAEVSPWLPASGVTRLLDLPEPLPLTSSADAPSRVISGAYLAADEATQRRYQPRLFLNLNTFLQCLDRFGDAVPEDRIRPLVLKYGSSDQLGGLWLRAPDLLVDAWHASAQRRAALLAVLLPRAEALAATVDALRAEHRLPGDLAAALFAGRIGLELPQLAAAVPPSACKHEEWQTPFCNAILRAPASDDEADRQALQTIRASGLPRLASAAAARAFGLPHGDPALVAARALTATDLHRLAAQPVWDLETERAIVAATLLDEPAMRKEAYLALKTRDKELWPCAWLVYEAEFDPDPSVRALVR